MLRAYPVPGKRKSEDLCRLFIEGAPRGAEGAVFYGVTQANQAEWVRALKRGTPFYTIDNSYLDATRGTHFRVTRNALQHPGTGTSTGRRLEQLGIRLRPWIIDAERSDTALVLEQSPDFIRILHGHQPEPLVRRMLSIARMAGLRPHLREWNPNKAQQMASFGHQLEEVRRVITFSSAGAVRAAIEGVPYHVLDPRCAAARFSTAAASLFDTPAKPTEEQRWQWLAVLADNQFTRDELCNGMAWAMLHRPPQETTIEASSPVLERQATPLVVRSDANA